MAKPRRAPAPPRNPLERAFEARFHDRVGPDVPKWKRLSTKVNAPWALGPHARLQAERLAAALNITVDECLERQAHIFLAMDDVPAEETYREATRNGR